MGFIIFIFKPTLILTFFQFRESGKNRKFLIDKRLKFSIFFQGWDKYKSHAETGGDAGIAYNHPG